MLRVLTKIVHSIELLTTMLQMVKTKAPPLNFFNKRNSTLNYS